MNGITNKQPIDARLGMFFTKLLDVKDPKVGTEKSVGIDLYMPVANRQFFEAIEKLNGLSKLEVNPMVDGDDDEYVDVDSINGYKSYDVFDSQKRKCIRETRKVFEYVLMGTSYLLIVYQPMTIPTGIALHLPEDKFADIRPRSSNLKNNYTIVLGTVDEDYTYGMGAQIIPIVGGVPVVLVMEERLCQLLIQDAKYFAGLYLEEKNFSNLEAVRIKRGQREGGFGHTGKN